MLSISQLAPLSYIVVFIFKFTILHAFRVAGVLLCSFAVFNEMLLYSFYHKP